MYSGDGKWESCRLILFENLHPGRADDASAVGRGIK